MIPDFKIRASGAGNIMTSAKGNITEKQIVELDLLNKKEKLTEIQKKKISDLTYKKDNPVLSDTAKTYCKDWLKGKLYNRKKTFTNKYTEKGLITEDNSLDFIAEQLDLGLLIKNEEYKENDFFTGTCDAITNDLIIDVKNSWSPFTFPLFEIDIPNNNYMLQGQIYMELYQKRHFELIYVISDTPTHLIQKEAYWYAKNNGFDENDPSIYMDFLKSMTYSDIRSSLKIKIFDFEYDKILINKMEKRVVECRNYINELLKMIN